MLNTISSSWSEKNTINIVEWDLNISLVLNDMTQIEADAYVVPHFNWAASFGGVGWAIVRGGALKWMEEYEQIIETEKQQEGKDIRKFQKWSKATLTESGWWKSKFLIHVVSVASSAEEEFNVVSSSVSNALIEANRKWLETVIFPALGTGIIGNLTAKQAAKAIMNGVVSFQKIQPEKDEKQSIKKIMIAIYWDQKAFNDFGDILKNQSYESVQAETGEKKLNISERMEWMKKDWFDTGFIGIALKNDDLRKYTYSVQNLVLDAIADQVLVPWEGMKDLIRITTERNRMQWELLKVIADADKKKKKWKNLARSGMIDNITYWNPKKYLEAVIKKYEEMDDFRIKEEDENFLDNIKLNSVMVEKRKTAVSKWNNTEINKQFKI